MDKKKAGTVQTVYVDYTYVFVLTPKTPLGEIVSCNDWWCSTYQHKKESAIQSRNHSLAYIFAAILAWPILFLISRQNTFTIWHLDLLSECQTALISQQLFIT